MLVAVILSAPLSAQWSQEDVALESAWQVLHVMDWAQTRYAADHPDKYKELNPLLGRHPTKSEVDRLMIVGAIGHFLVTDFLTADRVKWLWATTAMKAIVIYSNWSIGVRFEFTL